ncbi:transglycosylase SLT domain-containing protein [Nocardia sp. NBC_00565]|uniref:transglycosylase SLT domain-containing protein n=1 Tax=Nocardia sp. NBC_00565 TaxID=2975993 RepID=UPI002E818BEA|nr:transglycosylase SLT domain-containing protein [Nocardia sp. NBC_00565]
MSTPTREPPQPREPPEPSVDDARLADQRATTTAPRRKPARGARGNGQRAPGLAPSGTPPAPAAGQASPLARSGPLAAPTTELSTPTTTSTSVARPDAQAWQAAASMPAAAAALGALASIAAQYGDGNPTADTGQPYSPPRIAADRPTGPMALDGEMSPRYAADQGNRTQQTDAHQELNTELGRLLGGAAETTIQGRAAIDSIIAEVNTALTALGTVADSAAGRQLVIATLGNALQRAGTVLGQGQVAAALTADRIAALGTRYLQHSRPARPTAPRRSSHPDARVGRGGPPRTRPSGQQGQWINEALRVLRENGYDTRQISAADIATIIQHESGGNPNAINLWDSNAAKGIPSKGLMQTIDPTFNAYSVPGHRDIWNPVDNIVAGVRYAIHRYGSVSNVPGVEAMHNGGNYVGY